MTFRCQITKRISRPGDKLTMITTQLRRKVYTSLQRDEETNKLNTVEVGSGWEIAKELRVSEEGAAIWNASHPNGAEKIGFVFEESESETSE